MSFFATISHVKYVAEINAIRLSLRSSEEQVEEFLLPIQDVYLFANTNPDSVEKWFGEGCIQGRRDAKAGILRIQVDYNRRTVFKMPRSNFDLMLAQIRSEITKGDVDGARLIFSQIRPTLDTSEIKSVLDEKLDLEVFKNELLNQIDILIKTRLKEIPLSTATEKITPKTYTKVAIKSRTPTAFIPSDLGQQEISGSIKVQKTSHESSTLEEAAKLLKQSKRSTK